jgi:hypothetical protein
MMFECVKSIGKENLHVRSAMKASGIPKHMTNSKTIRRVLSELSKETFRDEDTVSRCLQIQSMDNGRA